MTATRFSAVVHKIGINRSAVWWTIGFGSPLLLFVIAQLAARMVGQTVPTWAALGYVNFFPDLGMGAWGLWFSYTAIGLRIVPGFFLGVLAGAIVLTWLYNSSGGSVLAAVLWHASFNFVTASPNAGGLVAAVTSTLVMVWAVAIVWRYDWATLASRSTATRSVRASLEERMRPLPGDELIAEPIASLNRAVTIRRPRHDVCPWLVQMGAGSRVASDNRRACGNRGVGVRK